MKRDASASETHTPAGTVTATPAQHLLRRPQAHTSPYLSWLADWRGGLSRDHAGETRKTAPWPLPILFYFALFALSGICALISVFFPFRRLAPRVASFS